MRKAKWNHMSSLATRQFSRITIAGPTRSGTSFFANALSNADAPYTGEITQDGEFKQVDNQKYHGPKAEPGVHWRMYPQKTDNFTKGGPAFKKIVEDRFEQLYSTQERWVTKLILDHSVTWPDPQPEKWDDTLRQMTYWDDTMENCVRHSDLFIYCSRPVADIIISGNSSRQTNIWNYTDENREETYADALDIRDIEWITGNGTIKKFCQDEIFWTAWAQSMSKKYEHFIIKDYSNDLLKENYRWLWHHCGISMFRRSNQGNQKVSEDPEFKKRFRVVYNEANIRQRIKEIREEWACEQQ